MSDFYERLIGIVKSHIKKVLAKLILARQQLEVFLFEVECVVNSRPLTYVPSEFPGERALSPSDFLSINSKSSSEPRTELLPHNPKEGSAGGLLQTWLKGIKHVNSFWKKWRVEYLRALRELHRWDVKQKAPTKKISPSVGDVVQIMEDLPRGTWKLGRIEEIHSSSDGNVRAVSVRMGSGQVLTKSLADLSHLELDEAGGETSAAGVSRGEK